MMGIPAGFANFEHTLLGKKGWKCNISNKRALIRSNDLSVVWYSVELGYDSYSITTHTGVSISDYRKDEYASKALTKTTTIKIPSNDSFGLLIRIGDALAEYI